MDGAQYGDTVSLAYEVKQADGTVFDSAAPDDPMVFQLGDEDILEGFQARLVGMCRGERRSFTVPSREAYGDVHPALIKEIPKKEIPIEDLKDGEFLNFRLPDGDSFTARVVEARQNAILCDFNHVLAGKDLFFDVEILDIRKEI